MRPLFCALPLLLAAAAPLHAQEAAVRALRLAEGERLVLDGTLSHPAWQRAPVHERFVEKDPRNGAEPPQRTSVRVLFDERAVWVGVTAYETEPERMRDVPVRADGVNRTQDFVVVYVDAIGNKQSAQFFRLNAAGSTADGLHTAADDSEDFAPDFDWDGAVARFDGGWTAVLRLPFASLRFAEGAHDWRFMVGRRLPREQFHLVMSVPIPRDAPSFIDRLQPLQGVELPASHQFLTLRPSVTLRRERTDGVDRHDADASLDLKWRPRAEALVDATLNPDFSQVALDVPQLAGNTRFALTLTEKRPFFFESADLLRSPTEAFYTRSFTQPRWGLRGTWRGTVWSGSAFAIDDRGGGFVLLPGAYGTGVVDQPGSRTLAARVRNDSGALQGGALVAARRYENGLGENTVLGPDLGWQIDGAWRLRAQWLHSRSTAFTGGDTRDGDRVYAKLFRLTDDSEFTLAWDESDRGFRHDSGFVNQVGVRHLLGFGSRRLGRVGPFNDFFVNLQVEDIRERGSGDTVFQDLRPGLYATAARNLEWWFELHPGTRMRVGPGAPLLDERYVETGLVFSPASWFPLFNSELEIGRLADTQAVTTRRGLRWTITPTLRPLKPLELEPRLSLGVLREGGRSTYRESALQWLAVWHFDARHTLRAIVQRSHLTRRAETAPVAVDGVDARDRVTTLTYAWRRSAGTVVYVGGTRAEAVSPVPSRTHELFLKVQFDADEVRGAWGG
jgi:hypothetical protein